MIGAAIPSSNLSVAERQLPPFLRSRAAILLSAQIQPTLESRCLGAKAIRPVKTLFSMQLLPEFGYFPEVVAAEWEELFHRS